MSKKHDIIWFETLESTNDEAGRLIHNVDNLSVVAALEQTAGRGQGNHTWLSPRGENLLFSVMLKFSEGVLAAGDVAEISLHTSKSIVNFLARHGIEAWVKPPNDVYVGRMKICGTLIENSIEGAWVSSSIIGIGLNVNQLEFDASLPNPTSMALQTNKAYALDVCLEEFLNMLDTEISQLLF